MEKDRIQSQEAVSFPATWLLAELCCIGLHTPCSARVILPSNHLYLLCVHQESITNKKQHTAYFLKAFLLVFHYIFQMCMNFLDPHYVGFMGNCLNLKSHTNQGHPMNNSWDHFKFRNILLRETDLPQKAYKKKKTKPTPK